MTDTADRMELPAPGWSPLTVAYWEAARQGRLVVQRCGSCGFHRWPPAWACFNCQSTDWTWDQLPGTGNVFTYTWADARPIMDSPLYNVSVIELDGTTGGPVRLMTRVVDIDKEGLTVGLPVEVCFDDFDDETAVPMFRKR